MAGAAGTEWNLSNRMTESLALNSMHRHESGQYLLETSLRFELKQENHITYVWRCYKKNSRYQFENVSSFYFTFTMANGTDAAGMPHNSVSHLGLNRLLLSDFKTRDTSRLIYTEILISKDNIFHFCVQKTIAAYICKYIADLVAFPIDHLRLNLS